MSTNNKDKSKKQLGSRVAKVATKEKSLTSVSGGSVKRTVNVYTSSIARSKWSEVKDKALQGEPVAILVGSRVLVLKEASLSYAELEYGVTSAQIHERSKKNQIEAIKEIRSGKARRII